MLLTAAVFLSSCASQKAETTAAAVSETTVTAATAPETVSETEITSAAVTETSAESEEPVAPTLSFIGIYEKEN